MFELRCTVRRCAERLQQRSNTLACPAGHHFDRAKSGYWGLLQPQDRKSTRPGDSDEAVLARQRWIERGHMSGLIDALRPWADPSATAAGNAPRSQARRTVDLGCGEGSFGRALFEEDADQYCGIDLSKRALKIAARHWPDATWVLANADRTLPVSDESVQRVMSLFGRRPAAEIRRVLVVGGTCVVAVPAEDDLIELRESVQQSGHRRSRWESVAEELTRSGLELLEHRRWSDRTELDPDAIADALAMTYRAVRRSQQQRAEALTSMRVTLAADLMRFRRPE